MSTTPPPTSRVRTPPTPRHGARYDNYEPYSPRRSSRVSSMRNTNPFLHSLDVAGASSSSSSSSRLPSNHHLSFTQTSTPRKASLHRTSSSQTLSPPSSPDFEHRHATPKQTQQQSSSVRRSLFTSRAQLSLDTDSASESDNLHVKPSPASVVMGMLPTPSKTPRKNAEVASMPTARILNFQPASLEHVMPTPRKQRKSRLTLYDEDSPQPEQISVFTDTHDRIPDVDHSDDNPFIGSRKKATKPSSFNALLSASHAENDAEMEEAVRNNEGLIYVFRGKKIFRPFSSRSPDNTQPESAEIEQASLKRKAGASTHRPITRSLVKPRLLWPSEEQVAEKEAREAARNKDEEADTDIEEEHAPLAVPQLAKDLITPAKKVSAQAAQIMTPPSSHRATRSASKKLSFLSNFDTIPELHEPATPASPAATPMPQQKAPAKKYSPFESWQRTKPTVAGVASSSSSVKQGKRRAMSPLPEERTTRKRQRSITPGAEHA